MADARCTVLLLLQELSLFLALLGHAQEFVPDENASAFVLLVLDILEDEHFVVLAEVPPAATIVQPVGIAGAQLQHSSI